MTNRWRIAKRVFCTIVMAATAALNRINDQFARYSWHFLPLHVRNGKPLASVASRRVVVVRCGGLTREGDSPGSSTRASLLSPCAHLLIEMDAEFAKPVIRISELLRAANLQ
ncbi:hypothetical protein DBV15_05700 [Temnothorax longispinosus]|uniref:Uncharacterized protein n=1 Tax=Temnothorax longispinosus TaxID=300112 RepID=A0A4S2J9H9_9HYME|nr:hypothetical protein DBV15_05700 [Temnothorax longispinosus]